MPSRFVRCPAGVLFLLLEGFLFGAIGCQASPPDATSQHQATQHTPSAMPLPKLAPPLEAQVAALIEAYLAEARQQHDQKTLTDHQAYERDRILSIWSGKSTHDAQRHVLPSFSFDPAMLWAVRFAISGDPTLPEAAKRKGRHLELVLLAQRAITDGQYASARALCGHLLLSRTPEAPTGEHANQTARAFMLMGDHDGLCRWYRWHLNQRRAALTVNKHTQEPRALVKINEEMAEQWIRLARMEKDRDALIGWTRVLYTPNPPWIEGTNHAQHVSYDPDAYSNRWREAWQAWALGLPQADQQRARQRFLEGVETGWRERVMLDVNRYTEGPTELADASQAEFERCLKRFKEAKWPQWGIRSFKSGPFDADKARASQQRMKQAWADWADTLNDENPAADVEAYVRLQRELLAHIKALNRVDDYYFSVKNRLDQAQRFLTFDFDELLSLERERRRYAVFLKDRTWTEDERQANQYQQKVESAHFEGEWEVLLELERPNYHKHAPPFGAEHDRAAIREVANNYDTHYFIWLMDRHFDQHDEPPRHFSPYDYQ